ncbi:MAG: hypothetical protein HY828_16905 [Actinobacteria bacterium]|nr:hypothetical protein [Actinomycetota bacterium]
MSRHGGVGLDERGATSPPERRASFRERDRLHERGDVMAALDLVLSGERRHVSRVLVVEGGPGLGKTALVNAAKVHGGERDWTVRSVECRPTDRQTPFAAAAGLFGPEVAEAFRRSGTDAARAVMWEALDGAATNGVLLVIDDARLADDDTWVWLLDLMARPPQTPIAVVIAAEPRAPGTDVSALDVLAAHPRSHVFRLLGLSEGAVAALLRERFPSHDIPRRLPVALHEATAGCPLLVHRALSALRHRGIEPSAALHAGRWTLASPSIVSWVLARLRDAPTDAIAALRAVAVLGDGTDVRSVAAVASAFGGMADANGIADHLADRDILMRSRSLAFVHPIVRLSIYEEISSTLRSAAHRLAAQHARATHRPEAEVAEHLLHTDPDGDPRTVEALLEAAQRRLDADLLDDVDQYVARALAEPPSARQLPAVLSVRAVLRARAGEGDPVEVLREAAAVASELMPVVRAGLEVVETIGNRHAALDVVTLLSSLSIDAPLEPADRVALGVHRLLLEGTRTSRDELRQALEDLQLQPHTGGRRGHDAPVVQLATLATVVERAADPAAHTVEDLVAIVHDGVPLTRLLRSPLLTQLLADLARLLVGAGEVAAAHDLVETCVASIDPSSDAWAWLELSRIEADVACGRLAAAERDLAALLASSVFHGDPRDGAEHLLYFVRDLRGEAVGDPSAVGSRVRHELTQASVWQQLHLLELEARVSVARGDHRTAAVRYRTARDIASLARVSNPAVTGWRSGMAATLVAQGDMAGAREMATEELTAAEAFGALPCVARALRALADATLDVETRIDLLKRAHRLLDGRPLALDRCLTDLALGAALHRAERDEAARLTLRRAADLAVRMDAGTLMEAAHRELVAAGARPRRLAQSGASALTPAERKVAGLAAAGRKNSEIASDLYISVKTVESHLARVYRKLEVDGRTQLMDQWLRLMEQIDPL